VSTGCHEKSARKKSGRPSERDRKDIARLNADGTVKGFQKIASGVGGGPTLADFGGFGSSMWRSASQKPITEPRIIRLFANQ
jgi:hypothetical protein